jgi:hypothetical protein
MTNFPYDGVREEIDKCFNGCTVVRANVVRRPTLAEQFRQAMQHVVGAQAPSRLDLQALTDELVDDSEHAELVPVARPALDKVVGPDVPG